MPQGSPKSSGLMPRRESLNGGAQSCQCRGGRWRPGEAVMVSGSVSSAAKLAIDQPAEGEGVECTLALPLTSAATVFSEK